VEAGCAFWFEYRRRIPGPAMNETTAITRISTDIIIWSFGEISAIVFLETGSGYDLSIYFNFISQTYINIFRSREKRF
jgi:hypothetical protein